MDDQARALLVKLLDFYHNGAPSEHFKQLFAEVETFLDAEHTARIDDSGRPVGFENSCCGDPADCTCKGYGAGV